MTRGTAGRLLAAYALVLAFVLLNPSADIPSTVVGWLAELARGGGVPAGVASGGRVEFLTNAVILMPLSVLGSLVWRETNWRDWTAYAFVVSGFVETVQALLLPDRSATFVDVVTNTLGGALGAGLVAVVGQRRARRPH